MNTSISINNMNSQTYLTFVTSMKVSYLLVHTCAMGEETCRIDPRYDFWRKRPPQHSTRRVDTKGR